MAEIPESALRSLAERLSGKVGVPDDRDGYDWRFVDVAGPRVRLTGENGVAPASDGAGEGGTAAVDFRQGDVARFTHQGVEYEAAWDRESRLLAYRMTGDPEAPG